MGRLSALRRQLGALTDAALAADLAGARQAWLTAHVTWLTIGQDDGAYGAFGDLGRAIDGTAAGLVGGTGNPRFTGFHKVELDLWRRSDPGAAAGDAQHLGRLVARLQVPRAVAAALPATRAGVTAWTLRCHEILEDALRDSLSGDDDYGSGTALASVDADVLATREMLGLLAPLITPRSPYLVGTARRQLTHLTTAIGAAIGEGPLPIARLARTQRERIDSAIGAVLETLAPVPDLLAIGST
jgi:high-affinity iron transporter